MKNASIDSPCIKPTPELLASWREDGFTPLSWRQNGGQVQLVFDCSEQCPPSFMAQRIKGRWQHAMKPLSGFAGFTANFFLRSLGRNLKEEVSHYIHSQAVSGDFADPLCRKRYHQLQYTLKDQQDPRTGERTNYDLFYHVIVVSEARCRRWGWQEPEQLAEALPEGIACSSDNQLVLYELSLMPDHMHLLVRGGPRVSAQRVLDTIKDSSGRVLSRTALWQAGGYVGTVGPYRLQAVMKWNEAL